MNPAHLAEVDRALLLISEAREFAERTARVVAGEGGSEALVTALEAADRELLSVHGDLSRGAYFPDSREQLRLAG